VVVLKMNSSPTPDLILQHFFWVNCQTSLLYFLGSSLSICWSRFGKCYFADAECYGDTDPPPEGFGVGPNTLVHLLQAREYEHLSRLGGVRDLLCSLFFWRCYTKALQLCARLRSLSARAGLALFWTSWTEEPADTHYCIFHSATDMDITVIL
jgi:hypothetical protein